MRTFFLVLILSGLSLSCKKTKSSACPEPVLNCAGVNCILYNYYFDFRLIDKTTGADLVFGSNPRYSTGDIVLYQDMAQTTPIILIADNSQRLFRTNFAKEEMYLVVAGATTYKITVEFKAVDCCSSRVKNLSIDNQSLCTCCPDGIGVPVN